MYCGNYCESKGSIRQDLKGCCKHKLLRKKAKFPVRKIIWGPFFSYYRVWQTVGDILRGSTSFSYHCCIISRTIFSRPKKLLTSQIFENKGTIHSKDKNMDFFPRNIEHDKCQETLYRGPQGNLTKIAQKIKSFHWDLRSR